MVSGAESFLFLSERTYLNFGCNSKFMFGASLPTITKFLIICGKKRLLLKACSLKKDLAHRNQQIESQRKQDCYTCAVEASTLM
jgi:hypothetical protein